MELKQGTSRKNSTLKVWDKWSVILQAGKNVYNKGEKQAYNCCYHIAVGI